MGTAFDYARDYGMEPASDYGYTAKDGTCHYDSSKVVCKPTGRVNVPPNSVKQLKQAIATGPVSVAIEADTTLFQFYAGGVINSVGCGINVDHGVLAVGYGLDNNKREYYIVKNSWGTQWGMNGYVNIAAVDGAGICGIQSEPVYPEF